MCVIYLSSGCYPGTRTYLKDQSFR